MDSFFNDSAADWAREVVMKMDDDAAVEFVTHVTRSVLLQDIGANSRTLGRHVQEVHKSLLRDAQKVVSKGTLTPVAVIEEVIKAFGDDPFSRDRNGRFSTTESRVRTNKTTAPQRNSAAEKEGIPRPKQPLRGQDLSGYQQQYRALAEAMDRAVGAGGEGVTAVLQDKKSGYRQTAKIRSLQNLGDWNPQTHDIIAVRYDRPGTAAGQASFDLVSSLAGPNAGNRAQAGVQGVQEGGSAFADRWTDASGDNEGTNDRTYRRIQAGSQLLGNVSTSPKVQAAAKFGEFVGSYGPEAEKVVGPHMRKTAYRYRGIEKKPDSELVRLRNERVKALEVPESDQSVAQIAARRATGGSTVDPEQKAVASVQASSEYLLGRLPSIQLSEIQRKSGRIPPSEGVIIDRDGKIAVQAVGHADDHYMPFNLKNLKSLRGGEYVRTRTKGGLTTEDIYTGLVSGARQATVVSNSGVFTINFSDDFRGVRRYNDKAATMVDRYAKTLDAIKEGQIEREPINPAVKAELREEVEREMGSYASRAEIETEVSNRVKEYRETPQLTTKEIESIDRQAEQAGKNEGDVRRIRSQLLDAALENKQSRFYQLDGQGYAAALESLREQYPYYIESVTFAHKREALGRNGQRSDKNYSGAARASNGKLVPFTTASDKGYVKARHNRPDDVMEGYYDQEVRGAGEVKGTGKTRASHTNYQNWEHNPTRRGRLTPTEAATEGGEAKATSNAPKAKSATEEFRRAKAEVDASANRKQALKGLVEHFNRVDLDGDDFAIIQEARTNFDAVAGDPQKASKLERELEELRDNLAGSDNDSAKKVAQSSAAAFSSLKMESGRLGGVTFDPKQHLGQASDAPYQFTEKAYQPGADADTVGNETRAVEDRLGNLGVNLGAGESDDTLKAASASAGKFAQLLSSGDVTSASASRALAELAGTLGMDEQAASRQLQRLRTSDDHTADARKYARIAENIERLRALNTPGASSGGTSPGPKPKEAPLLGAKGPKAAAEAIREFASGIPDGTTRDEFEYGADLLSEGKTEQAIKHLRQVPGARQHLKGILPDIDDEPR